MGSDLSLPAQGPTISAIVITYDRPEMVRHALRSLIDQTYRDLEIVVVLNGATDEVRRVVKEIQFESNRLLTTVNFTQNIYDFGDLCLMIRTVYKAGYEAASGEFVFFQSDDDYVAPDFFSRMARLFVNNSNCETAIGLPLSHHWSSRVVDPAGQGAWSSRQTYTDGMVAALKSLDDRNYPGFMANPGFSYVMSRHSIDNAADFWGGFELTQLLQVVAFSETGFDPKAEMYWGRGEHQGNVIVDQLPTARSTELKRMYIALNQKELDAALEMWRVAFDEECSKELIRLMRRIEGSAASYQFMRSLRASHFSDAWRTLILVGGPSPHFISRVSIYFARGFAQRLPRKLKDQVRRFLRE